MKVLITGAAGKVGRAVRKELSGKHQLRLLDILRIEDPEGEFIQGSVTDREVVHQAVADVDGIIQLAYGRGADSLGMPPDEWSFEVNVKGTYNLLREAVEAGVERVVYASTTSVYEGRRPKGGEVFDEEAPLSPRGTYSFTKYLGEEVCRFFANAYGLSSICLRLTGVTEPKEWERVKMQVGGYPHWRRTSTADVAQAFRLALEKEGVLFGIFHICSDNPDCRWDIRRAREILGFRPRDRFESPREVAKERE